MMFTAIGTFAEVMQPWLDSKHFEMEDMRGACEWDAEDYA